jgi:hypothetical protein
MTLTAQPPVGAGGFQGSPITAWCATCTDWVVPSDKHRCMWCGDQLPDPDAAEPEPPREEPAPLVVLPPRDRALRHRDHRRRYGGGGKRPTKCKRMTEQQILACHRHYTESDDSLVDTALREHHHGYHGYRTATDLSYALRRAFLSRGLPVRDSQAAAKLRHAKARAAA